MDFLDNLLNVALKGHIMFFLPDILFQKFLGVENT